jgi:hypothetical protein
MANLTTEQKNTERAVRPYRKVNAQRRAKFLRALERTGNVTHSARHAGISVRNIYSYAKKNLRFANRMNEAREMFLAGLEAEAIRRGRDGYSEEIYQNGELVGYRTRYSDRLLETALRATDPARYGGKSTVTVEGNEANPVALTAIPPKMVALDTEKLRAQNKATHTEHSAPSTHSTQRAHCALCAVCVRSLVCAVCPHSTQSTVCYMGTVCAVSHSHYVNH